MLRADDFHLEFGYLCPMPRARRELHVALRSLLLGMLIGAALVANGAGEAREADHAARDAQSKPSEPHPLRPDVREPGLRLNNPDASNMALNPPIKPYPMRMVRVRSTKPGGSSIGEQR